MRRVELTESAPIVLLGVGSWMVLIGLWMRRSVPDIERASKGMGILEYRGPSRTPDQWRRRHAIGVAIFLVIGWVMIVGGVVELLVRWL